MPQSSAAELASGELAELRRTELEAMGSILGTDFRVLSQVWNNAATAQVQTCEVVLRPEIDELKDHVAVVAEFALTRQYPNVAPTCHVRAQDTRTLGVTVHDMSELEEKLNSQARSLVGAEMLWELVSFGQEFISTHNCAPNGASKSKLSLEETMRRRADAVQEETNRQSELEAQRITDEAKRQSEALAAQIDDETRRQITALKYEKQRLRDTPLPLPPADETVPQADLRRLDEAAWATSLVSLAKPLTMGEEAVVQLRRGPLLESRSLSKVYVAVPVVSTTPPDAMWLLEMVPVSSPYYASGAGTRKLTDLTAILRRLTEIDTHSLSSVLSWCLSPPQAPTVLTIVHKAVQCVTFDAFLRVSTTLSWRRASKFLGDALHGLHELHRRGMVHGNLGLASFELKGDNLALRGAMYEYRLADLHRSNPLNGMPQKTTSVPMGWRSHESINNPLSYTSSRDIWDLGRCMCEVLWGESVLQQYPTPEALWEECSGLSDTEIPAELDAQGAALLQRMLHRDERQRGSASELLQALENKATSPHRLSWPTQPSSHASMDTIRSVKDARAAEAVIRPERHTKNKNQIGSFWQLRDATMPSFQSESRYLSDFEEVEFLGKGAFGVVVKARNKLDERFYAVKKIKLSSAAAEEERTMREIMALSRLDHPHIVRYVTCWIERTVSASLPPDSDASADQGFDVNPMTTSQQLDSSALRDLQHLPHRGIDDFLSMDKDSGDESDFIQFGNSSTCLETSSSEESVTEDSQTDSNSASDLQASEAVTRVLYIQMEYVENHTLGDAIERGLSIETAWHIFRQMLEALAHIASLGIIHRDLKPSNVLMDAHGDIKIGDFGLATTNLHAVEPTLRESITGSAPAESTELTSGLGTFSYIAPEVLSKQGVSARYNQKVDMFSLGIIFFEMIASQRCYKTTMERYQLLRELRQPNIQFPSNWEKNEWVAQTAIIRQLLDHDPAARPTPMAMLRSPLLPPKMEDESVQELLRLAANPTSVHRHELIHALFARPQADVLRDFTFDTGAQDDEDDVLVGVVTRYLREMFQRRGAVPVHPPLLFPPNEVYSTDKGLVKLLDQAGKVVFLPFDLTVPFARICARSGHARFKRFDIADVYRDNVLAGGQPRAILAASFDIVSQEADPAAESEVLGVLDELLSIPGLAGEAWQIELSHELILRKFMQRFPPRYHDTLLSALPHLLARGTEARAKQQLQQAGLPPHFLEEVEAWNLSSEYDYGVVALKALLTQSEKAALAEPLAYLDTVVRLLRQFGVRLKVVLVPLLSHSHTFYRHGAMFAVSRLSHGGKHRDVLAVGGRYDELLRHFAYPRSRVRGTARAVGIQIAVGKLVKIVAKYQKVQMPRFLGRPAEECTLGPWTPRRCECYVAASQPGLMEAKIRLCTTLWAHRISADLQYEDAAGESPEDTAATCRAEGILLLILVRAHTPVLKVKEVLTRAEHEVAHEDLISFLGERIARQRRIDRLAAPRQRDSDTPKSASTSKNPSHVGASATPRGHNQDIHVMLPGRGDRAKRTERRLKPATLHAMADRAASEVQRLADQLTSGGMPIFVVDLPPPVFDRFAVVATASDEVFRAFLTEEKLRSDHREYAKGLRDQILHALENDTPNAPGTSTMTSSGPATAPVATMGPRALLCSLKDGRTAWCH